MKIAQIVASLESRHGGPSRSVRALSRALADIGDTEVNLLSTQANANGAPLTEGRLATRIFAREWPRFLTVSKPLNAHLQSSDYDLVHHHGLWLRTLHYATASARRSGIPLVVSPRGMMSPWAWNHHRARKLAASALVHPGALSRVSGWHATSENEATEIRALGFTAPVCIAPNGVRIPSAESAASAEQHWLRLLPSLSDKRVALFYSRLHSKKRVLELIDLWLSKRRDDWVLLVAGIPEQYSVRQLDAYLLRNGGVGRVLIHDGTHEPPPYPVASLFLLPSHSENFGLVVAEAMAHGVPVLVTDRTPWSGLPDHGAGECVSWDEYGHALDRLLASSPETLANAGRAGQRWISSDFSWDETARRLSAFYASLASSR